MEAPLQLFITSVLGHQRPLFSSILEVKQAEERLQMEVMETQTPKERRRQVVEAEV